MSGLKEQLQDETSRSGHLSEVLAATESQSEERAATISFLKQQVDHLKEEVKVVQRCDSDRRVETVKTGIDHRLTVLGGGGERGKPGR